MKKVRMLQYPRGVNKGGVLSHDYCPTISTSSWQNNCALMEIVYETEDTDRGILLEESAERSGL